MIRRAPVSTVHTSNGIIPSRIMSLSPADLENYFDKYVQHNPTSHRPEFQWYIRMGSLTVWSLTREELEEKFWNLVESRKEGGKSE